MLKMTVSLFMGFLSSRIATTDPFLLPLPPIGSLVNRLKALCNLHPQDDTDYYETFPPHSRGFLLLRLAFYLLMAPFWVALWHLDDILFPTYKQEDLSGSVFLVGGFRTGSTSLHRAMSLDDERFVSPRFLELAMPFITLHKFIDFLEWIDGKLNTEIILRIEKRLQGIIGEECMARHPMSFYEAEEDDVLLAAWHFAGWYIGTMFPDAKAWKVSGEIGNFPENEQKKVFKFYERSLQKVLYRRGGGRKLLSKSHLIEFMPILEKNLPSAHFISTVRHPKDTFVSWYALSQAASEVMGRWKLPVGTATKAHYVFWQSFANAEMNFFLNDGEKKKENTTKTIVTFNTYIKNQEETVKRCYESMGLKMSKEFEKALDEDAERHKNYKANRGYDNPTLEDLGTSERELSKKLATYIKAFEL